MPLQRPEPVLAWKPVELDAVNAYYGTSLRASDLDVRLVPAALRMLDALPLQLFKICVRLRLVRRVAPAYDLFLCANNEIDFGRPGIQSIHFPWSYWPRPEVDLRWYHSSLSLVRAHRRCCISLARVSFARVRRNLTLVNSDWTAGKTRECHGIESVTLHPPATGVFPDVPWEQREDGFVCVGRFSPEKNLEDVIDVVAELHARFPSVHLHLVGGSDGRYSRYGRRPRCWRARTSSVSGRPQAHRGSGSDAAAGERRAALRSSASASPPTRWVGRSSRSRPRRVEGRSPPVAGRRRNSRPRCLGDLVGSVGADAIC